MADHHWPTPTDATSLAQGKVLGACDGRSTSEIVVTIAGDGISVIHMETLVRFRTPMHWSSCMLLSEGRFHILRLPF